MHAPDEKNLENMLLLSTGKLFGFLLAFFIPFFLSRWLTIESYGTYKQLILLWMIFLQIQNLGMDLGLFYFVKTYPENAPIFSSNVIIVNFATTVLTVCVLNVFSMNVANILNNDQLTTYLPYFSLVLLFSIPAQHFEHYLVSLDKIKWSIALESVHEIFKSGIIILGFLLYDSLKYVLLMLSALYFIKLLTLIWFNHRLIKHRHVDVTKGATWLRKQVLYGFPLGIARLISAVIYFDKIIISFMYSITQFTVYSVGCFEIPFARTVLNTIWELAAMEMVVAQNENMRQRLIFLMKDTLRKISILSIPIVIFGVVFGNEIITFIFSSTYESSVPYFRLFMLTFITNSFDCELIFRVFKENKIFLKIQTLNLFLTLSMMTTFGVIYGPFGALGGKVIASFISLYIMFIKVRGFLKLSISDFVPWNNIAFITLACTTFSTITYIASSFIKLTGLVQLSFCSLLYFSLVFVSFSLFGIFSPMEKEYFKRKIVYLKQKAI